jgi:hypothetical protein
MYKKKPPNVLLYTKQCVSAVFPPPFFLRVFFTPYLGKLGVK